MSVLVLAVFSTGTLALHYSMPDESVCPCQFATFRLHVQNLQSAPAHQDLSVSTEPGVSAPSSVISVDADSFESKIIPISVYAACDAPVGDAGVSLLADNGQSVNSTLHILPCNGLQLDVTPEQSVCQNEHADYSVTVRNLADSPRNVTLGTDLNPDSYVLPPSVNVSGHDSQTVVLSVNTNTLPQRLPFKVVARSDDGVFVEQPALIDVQRCSGLRVDGPSDVSLSEGQSQRVFVVFQNLGTTRTINLEAFCPSFVQTNVSSQTLGPDQSAVVTVGISAAPAGVYPCTLRATSTDYGQVFTHTLHIHVSPASARYNVTPSVFTLEQGVLQNVTFQVHNDGLLESVPVSFQSNATLVSAGPSHALAQTDQVLVFFLKSACNGPIPSCPNSGQGFLVLGNQSVAESIRFVPPTLVFDSKVYSLPNGVQVDFVVTNTGNATVLHLSSTPASRGPLSVPVSASSQAFFSLFVDGNQSTLQLQAQTDRGVYGTSVDLTHPAGAAPNTGLVSFATPVIAFSIAILVALTLLYFLYRRGQARSA